MFGESFCFSNSQKVTNSVSDMANQTYLIINQTQKPLSSQNFWFLSFYTMTKKFVNNFFPPSNFLVIWLEKYLSSIEPKLLVWKPNWGSWICILFVLPVTFQHNLKCRVSNYPRENSKMRKLRMYLFKMTISPLNLRSASEDARFFSGDKRSGSDSGKDEFCIVWKAV